MHILWFGQSIKSGRAVWARKVLQRQRGQEVIMKVAIPASNQSMDGQLDPRFGRAKYFLIYDMESDEHEFITNELNMLARQGAGIQSAQTVAGKNVQAVVSAHVGPKAYAVLKDAQITLYSGEGLLRDIIDNL